MKNYAFAAIAITTIAGVTTAIDTWRTRRVEEPLRVEGELITSGLICRGGVESQLITSIELRAVNRTKAGEVMTLAIQSMSGFERPARVRHALHLRDDLGRPVINPEVSAVSRFLSRNEMDEVPFTIPPGLPDGYYALRVFAAGSDGERDASQIVDFYFRSRAKTIEPINMNEWFTQSRANHGFLIATHTMTEAQGGSDLNTAENPCPNCDALTERESVQIPGVTTGVVRGRFLFYNYQGSFCPNTGLRDCTGAKYPQSEFSVALPVRHAKVFLRKPDNGSIIAQGITDANGYFTFGWMVFGEVTALQANLSWESQHKDGRFYVRSENGGQWFFPAGQVTLSPNTTESSPQNLGVFQWGSSAANANQIANVYDGAWRTWQAFSASNRMNAYFLNVDIRAFDNSGVCPTSCAAGWNNRILLDPNSAFAPQARIMHEMGHIASYVSSRDQSFKPGGDYCFPSTGTGCTWNLSTPEWSAANFEEGLATFFADTTLYGANATEPHTCYASAAACANGTFNVETSTGLASACASNESRWPLTVARYLWDSYDLNQDYPGETLSRNLYEFFDTVHAFDNGAANNQKNEPWDQHTVCNGTQCVITYVNIVDRDGRSANDFRVNWAKWGTNSDTVFNNNCSPAGD